MEQIIYTVEEAAKILKISRISAYKGIESGQIPHIRIGRRILIPVAALQKLLDNPPAPNTQAPAPASSAAQS